MNLLHSAAARNDYTKVQTLLKVGYRINSKRRYDDATALICAAGDHRASQEMLELLINADAKVDHVTSNYGRNALHYAAQDGQLDKVKTLIKYELDINQRDNFGYSPLLMASFSKSKQKHGVISFLLELGANANRSTRYSETPVRVCSSEFDILQLFDRSLVIKQLHWSSLMLATLWGSIDDMKKSLLLSSDLHQRDVIGRTVWHLAIESGDVGKADFLYAHNLAMGETDTHYPNVFYAIRHDHRQMLEWLVDIGADVYAGHRLYTGLSYAAFNRASKCLAFLLDRMDYKKSIINDTLTIADDVRCIELLLKVGANIDHVNDEGYSALKFACETGDLDKVRFLLDNQANPDIPLIGETPLICAVRGDYLVIVQELLKSGANPNLQTNPDMWFALQSVQSEEMLATLLDSGAKTDLRDAANMSALHTIEDDRLRDMLEFAI